MTQQEQMTHSRFETISSGYYSKCLDLIKSMSFGEIRQLDKKSPNYNRFVQTLKMLIDDRQDVLHGCNIDFNSDYSRFRKVYLPD